MNEIKVVGKQSFMGKEIQVIEGGFGENQRIISAKEVANIHNMRLADLNASIKRLIDKNRIKEGIDYIDLLSETVSLRDFAKENGLIGSNKTSVVFILSERGYSKLIKSMDDDTSWDIMDRLIDEYFTMREVIKSDEQLLSQLLLKVYTGGQDAVLASKQITEIEVAKATKPLLEDISAKEIIIHKQGDEIFYKEGVIIDLTKDITLAQKRQRISQIVRHNSKKYQERYSLLYQEFEKKYHIDIDRRLNNGKASGAIKKSVNKMEYICSDKYLNMTNELYDVCVKVFEGDFIQLLDEWKDTVTRD